MKPLKLEDLTLEQKIGQLIIVRGFLNDEDRKFIMEMTAKKAVGGFQLPYTEGGEKLIEEINSTAGYPVLICANMEYGFAGTQLKFPALMALSAANDEELAYKAAQVTAIEAKKYGFNMIWGPVVDICARGKLCKNTRTFGDDPWINSRYAIATIKAYQDEGMLVTAKHYPGNSDIMDDSHLRSTRSYLTREELINKDMTPYFEIIKELELSGIMTSHTIFEKIDPGMPATLSKPLLSIIREAGYDGLIQSDSFAMMAICQRFGDKAIAMAIAAGCDQVLPNYRLPFKEVYNTLLEAYHEGIITEERLNEAVRRVLEAQAKTLKQPSSDCLKQEHIDAIEELNKKSLCYLSKDGIAPALSPDSTKVFVLTCENEFPGDVKETAELEEKDTYSRKNVEKQGALIREYFPDAEIIIINEFPNNIQNERVALAATTADDVIFCTYCRPHSYLGSDGITERMEYLINSNPEKTAAALHVGNPYEATKFPNAKRVFIGHLGGDSLKYTLKALKGEFIPTGKLPVTL
ncbi:MAG: glycoside hydrolase family 3 protein [Oscillospiraceae bacterium]|nr:glycoside hydrolase family 3 protein [Oscillospiraceae bacterium]